VQVCGATLPLLGRPTTEDGCTALGIVDCASTRQNLRALAEAILIGKPLILQGAPGSGKSFSLRSLAAMLSHDGELVELHLDEQIDSKTLLGGFVCSDVPGEFVWRAGVLAAAVQRGSW